MTPLEKHLHAIIRATGPVSVHSFMAEALMHQDYGYYRKRDPLGAAGDFITAPEISQIFGELIGLWLAERWEALGRPAPVRLVELGPGRGTLMADAVRALSVVPGLREAIDIHFVESNTALRAAQAKRVRASWHDRLSDVPPGPVLLIANEFFDALPIRQFVKMKTGWAERMVTCGAEGLEFCLGPAGAGYALIPDSLRNMDEGALAEVCPEALSLAGEIGRRISDHGGAALVIDYGYNQSAPGDSLQAIRRHQRVDVFHRPGESDLTAHVNFEQIAQAASETGVHIAGPITQKAFLEGLGIEVRAAILKRRATQKQCGDIDAAVRRLTAPDMMGHLFKVLAVQSLNSPAPGFEGTENG